jgi:hypothetical protein
MLENQERKEVQHQVLQQQPCNTFKIETADGHDSHCQTVSFNLDSGQALVNSELRPEFLQD